MESHSLPHRTRRYPALPWEDRTICYKSTEIQLRKLVTNIFLIFGKADHIFDGAYVKLLIIEGRQYTVGKKVKQDFDQFKCGDGPAPGRKSDLKMDRDITGLGMDGQGGPL